MTNTYIDTHIETQEIEVPGFLTDPKVLAYLEGTDADIDRLVLEEDNKLWAYSKRTPGDLCRSSLEDMVAVAFPSYFMADVVPVAVAVSAPVSEDKPCNLHDMPPKAPRATRKPRKAVAPYLSAMPLPVTGAARGLLASRSGGSGRPLSVLVNGVPRMVPKPIIEGALIKVHFGTPWASWWAVPS